MCSVRSTDVWRYSPVKNWLRDRNVARKLRIVGRQPLVRVVEGVAREELVRRRRRCSRRGPARSAGRASDRTGSVERRGRSPSDGAVGARILGQVRRDRRIDADRTPRRQDAAARALSSGTTVVMVLPRFSRSAFVADEVEQPVALHRAAERAAELVAREVGLARRRRSSSLASSASLRWYSKALPRMRLPPDFVSTLIWPPAIAAELRAVGVGLDAELAARSPCRAPCRRRCRPGRWSSRSAACRRAGRRSSAGPAR